jgi:hypothetical protein
MNDCEGAAVDTEDANLNKDRMNWGEMTGFRRVPSQNVMQWANSKFELRGK